MNTNTHSSIARRPTLVRCIAIFAAAAASGAVVARSTPAQAARALVPAAACYTESDFNGDYHFVNGAAIANSGSRARKVFCPIPTTDTNPRNPTGAISGISQFWVSGIDGNNEPPSANLSTGGNMDPDGRVLAQICMRDDWAGGTVCSSFVEVTSNTESRLFDTNIALSTLSTDPVPVLKNTSLANWYPTLVVSIPRPGVAGWSALHGFTTL